MKKYSPSIFLKTHGLNFLRGVGQRFSNAMSFALIRSLRFGDMILIYFDLITESDVFLLYVPSSQIFPLSVCSSTTSDSTSSRCCYSTRVEL